MESSYTLGARMLSPLRDHLLQGGADADAVLRSVGIEPALLDSPDSRIPALPGLKLWDAAARALDEPLLGLHVAARVTRDSFDLMSQVASLSGSFREMGERIARFHTLAAPRAPYQLREEGQWSWWIVPPITPDVELFRQVHEFTLAVGWMYTRAWGGEQCGIRRVHFAHRAAAPEEDYQRFFDLPVHFGQSETGLEIPSTLLDRALPEADSALAEVLDRYADHCVQQVPPQASFQQRLEDALMRQFPEGEPRLQTTARSLGMSPRTLQRRLEEEGSHFQRTLDSLRKSLALKYTCAAEIPLGEIGNRLGFSDPAAFRRAFKRWTGVSPRDYRKRHVKRTR